MCQETCNCESKINDIGLPRPNSVLRLPGSLARGGGTSGLVGADVPVSQSPFTELTSELGNRLEILERSVDALQEHLAPVLTLAEDGRKSDVLPEVGVQTLDVLKATINRVERVTMQVQNLSSRLVV